MIPPSKKICGQHGISGSWLANEPLRIEPQRIGPQIRIAVHRIDQIDDESPCWDLYASRKNIILHSCLTREVGVKILVILAKIMSIVKLTLPSIGTDGCSLKLSEMTACVYVSLCISSYVGSRDPNTSRIFRRTTEQENCLVNTDNDDDETHQWRERGRKGERGG